MHKGLLYASVEEAAGHMISHEAFNGSDRDIANRLNIGYFDCKSYSFNKEFFNFVIEKYGSDGNAVGVMFGKECARDSVNTVFDK